MAKNTASKDTEKDDTDGGASDGPTEVQALQRQIDELAALVKGQMERTAAAEARASAAENRAAEAIKASTEAPRAGVVVAAEEDAKPVREFPEGPIRVRAVKVGTYPEPGAIRARVRQPGEEFYIQRPEHFAEHGGDLINGWMVLADEPPAPVAPIANVPLTTVPNQLTQDPMGAPAGNAARLIQS